FGKAVLQNLDLLLLGYRFTVLVSLVALVASLIIGAGVALLRTSPLRLLQLLGAVYVEFFRNTPLLIQMYFYYFGLPKLGIRFDSFQSAALALSIYTGAFVAEVVRSGILSVDKGQLEAARSLGLSYLQTVRHVVLPQALAVTLAPLGNLFIALIKNSSVAYAIALTELLYTASLLDSRTFRTFEIFTALIVFYLTLTAPLALLVRWLEARSAPAR
ncbi:MAG: amino acid ABC transporter permease, partial [Chloroflexi bacterium]|nr:amino acid ABC transporter permease [Chloroflexota bacterium]